MPNDRYICTISGECMAMYLKTAIKELISKKGIFLLLTPLAALLIFFQNCSRNGFETQPEPTPNISMSSVETVLDFCTENTPPQACQQNNGSGTRMCDIQIKNFGVCELSSCDPGYNLQDGVCVQNQCAANSVAGCSVLNGAGTKTCNSPKLGFDQCIANQCDTGYTLSNGACVPAGCSPGTVSCTSNSLGLALNGPAVKTCQSSGSYGECQLAGTTCNSGYYFSSASSQCVEVACSQGSQMACPVSNGTGVKTCNAIGSGYDSCVVASCNINFHKDQTSGLCVANFCQQNSTQTCSTNSVGANLHGTGSKTCNSDGNAFGACVLSSCDEDYILQNGSCVYNPPLLIGLFTGTPNPVATGNKSLIRCMLNYNPGMVKIYQGDVLISTGTSFDILADSNTIFSENASSRTFRCDGYRSSTSTLVEVTSAFTIDVSVGADQQAPTAPSNLRGYQTALKSYKLKWDASTDNVGVTKYKVYYQTLTNFIGDVGSTLEPLAEPFNNFPSNGSFWMSAVDAAGNESTKTPFTFSLSSSFPSYGTFNIIYKDGTSGISITNLSVLEASQNCLSNIHSNVAKCTWSNGVSVIDVYDPNDFPGLSVSLTPATAAFGVTFSAAASYSTYILGFFNSTQGMAGKIPDLTASSFNVTGATSGTTYNVRIFAISKSTNTIYFSPITSVTAN